MTPESRSKIEFRSHTAYGALGFDPWTAQIATTDHAALNVARLVYRVVEFITDGFDLLAAGIQKLRAACPIEIEPVKIVRPAQPDRATNSADRAAA